MVVGANSDMGRKHGTAIVPDSARPLSAYPAFTVGDFDRLSYLLEDQLGARFAKPPAPQGPIDVVANSARLYDSELWYCAYGMPLSVQFPDGDYLRLQVQHKGAGGTWQSGALSPVTSKFACVSKAEVEIDFPEDFEQVVWRVPKGKLEQKLALVTGRPIGYALDFVPTIDLSTASGQLLQQLFRSLLSAVGNRGSGATQLVARELEQAFITTFLANTDHTGRALLDAPVPNVGPWQVRRAAAHIEANWDKPITIDDLVEVSGASARSLFRTFREARGCSPMEFARRLRLEHARRMLERPSPATTVTDVAFACGFGDLGRFARDFQRMFGERPSVLLARRRDIFALD